MIVIVDPRDGKMSWYSTLKSACRWEKWMNYSTLKNLKMGEKVLVYKEMWIYRIKHS